MRVQAKWGLLIGLTVHVVVHAPASAQPTEAMLRSRDRIRVTIRDAPPFPDARGHLTREARGRFVEWRGDTLAFENERKPLAVWRSRTVEAVPAARILQLERRVGARRWQGAIGGAVTFIALDALLGSGLCPGRDAQGQRQQRSGAVCIPFYVKDAGPAGAIVGFIVGGFSSNWVAVPRAGWARPE